MRYWLVHYREARHWPIGMAPALGNGTQKFKTTVGGTPMRTDVQCLNVRSIRIPHCLYPLIKKRSSTIKEEVFVVIHRPNSGLLRPNTARPPAAIKQRIEEK